MPGVTVLPAGAGRKAKRSFAMHSRLQAWRWCLRGAKPCIFVYPLRFAAGEIRHI